MTGYIVGQEALDVAILVGIEVQSLAYPTGRSPFFSPGVLHYAPEEAYIDLGRLDIWTRFRIVWLHIAVAHWGRTIDDDVLHE
jgi:hypothetical protein